MRRLIVAVVILTLGLVGAASAQRSVVAETGALFPARQQGKYGFIDRTGKIVIKPRFEGAGGFFEGRALVQAADKWGYIDTAGKVVINPRFDFANPFYDGLALVEEGKREYFINRDGTAVIDVTGQSAGFFHTGRARIKPSGKVGYIDRTGKPAIPTRFDGGLGFSEGLAGVKQGGKWGFIDLQGATVIPPQFEEVDFFAEGLAAVKLQGKYGFIDKTGKIVIELQYDFVRGFSEGLAAVRLENRYGYIDRQGRMVIPSQFREAFPFSESLAWVDRGDRRGAWEAIDGSGKTVFTMPSGLPGQFKNGLAHFQNRQSGYFDRTGKIIWLDTDNPAATSTRQPSKAAIWTTHRNDQYGFSFEYPAIYDEEANRETCGVRTDTNLEDPRMGPIKFQIQVGLQIYLFVLDPQGSSLGDFVNRFVKEREGAEWILQSKRDISVHEVKGKKIDFRFGGLRRYGTVTFVKRSGNIWLFAFTAGAQCDFPEQGIEELAAYEHMLKTFKFHRSGAG